jgi:hypothetical protein
LLSDASPPCSASASASAHDHTGAQRGPCQPVPSMQPPHQLPSCPEPWHCSLCTTGSSSPQHLPACIHSHAPHGEVHCRRDAGHPQGARSSSLGRLGQALSLRSQALCCSSVQLCLQRSRAGSSLCSAQAEQGRAEPRSASHLPEAMGGIEAPGCRAQSGHCCLRGHQQSCRPGPGRGRLLSQLCQQRLGHHIPGCQLLHKAPACAE